MNCPTETKNPELLVAFAAGKSDPETGAAIERHLAACPGCRETVAAQAALWKALDFWEAPPVSPDFDRRLYRRIGEEACLSWWQRILRTLPLRQALPLTATACLLIVAGLLLEQPNRLRHSQPPRETVRVEQVERTLDDLDLLQFGMPADAPPADKM